MFESAPFSAGLAELDETQTAMAVQANERLLIAHGCRKLVLAAHWADLHPGDRVDPQGLPGRETPTQPGGAGTPTVAGFCYAELGCLLGVTEATAHRLVADALDLRHRLPLTWQRVCAEEVPAFVARQIAQATHRLEPAAAGAVDARLAPMLTALPGGRLQHLLTAAVYEADPDAAEAAFAQAAHERFVRLGQGNEHGLKSLYARAAAGDVVSFKALVDRIAEILGLRGDRDSVDVRRSKALGIIAQPAEVLRLLCEHDETDEAERQAEPDEPVGDSGLRIVPPPFDPARARFKAVIHVHLSAQVLAAGTGVCRVEEVGPVPLGRLRAVLGDQVDIKVAPVVDLNDQPAPVDAYEIPNRMREHLRLRTPADVFPFAAGLSRGMDLDHTVPYVTRELGGLPGQTRIGNLGPLTRSHHRLRTHGGWRVRQPEPGTWVWRSPLGWVYLVNNAGTHPLGRSAYATAVWHAADPQAAKERASPAA